MAVVILLGILQFAIVYGFWNRKSWSYKPGLAIPIVAIITNWSLMFLMLTAPSGYLLFDPTGSVASLISGVIYISYLRKPHVKKWLRVE